MKKGFVGNAANRYFQFVGDKMDSGSRCANAGGSGSGENPADSIRTMSDRLLSDVSVNSVSVDEDMCEFIQRNQAAQEEDFTQKIHYAIDRMEQLCREKYIIPSATPKVEENLRLLRESLSTSNEITDDIQSALLRFVSAIRDADV